MKTMVRQVSLKYNSDISLGKGFYIDPMENEGIPELIRYISNEHTKTTEIEVPDSVWVKYCHWRLTQ